MADNEVQGHEGDYASSSVLANSEAGSSLFLVLSPIPPTAQVCVGVHPRRGQQHGREILPKIRDHPWHARESVQEGQRRGSRGAEEHGSGHGWRDGPRRDEGRCRSTLKGEARRGGRRAGQAFDGGQGLDDASGKSREGLELDLDLLHLGLWVGSHTLLLPSAL